MDVPGLVLIFAIPAMRGFVPQFAAWLKRERGAGAVLVVNTEQDRAYYAERHPGVFHAIETSQFRYTGLLEPLDNEQPWIEAAASYERRYGFRFMHLLMDDRHLGLGFSAAGTSYPTSRWAEAATLGKALRSFVQQLRFCEELIERHRPTLMINPTKPFCVIARKKEIPTRFLANVSFKSLFTWTVNEYMESNLLPRAFAAVSADGAPALEHHHDHYLRERERMLSRFRFAAMVKRGALDTARYWYWVLRRYDKRLGRRPLEQIRIHHRIWSDYRALRRERLARASDLAGKKIVYFPLAVEPEITLTRESPEFCHQHFAVHAIAKDLPPDTILAVKEHLFSIGMRPRGFYRDLAKIPNVVLVDPLEWGFEMIRRAAVVATINGTSGFEAAVLGKPVLAFGIHNKYNILPHVRIVQGWRDLPAVIAETLALAETPDEGRVRDGRRFLNALIAISVDCSGADFRQTLSEPLFEEIAGVLDHTLAPAPERASESVA